MDTPLKRIDLFMPPRGQYGSLHHFTTSLYRALVKLGAAPRLLESSYEDKEALRKVIMENPPAMTLSFNGLLPDEEERFFSDEMRIPHLAYVVDPPTLFFPLVHSPYTLIASIDHYFASLFQAAGGKRVLFMPHAVETDLLTKPERARKYGVVMLASFLDPLQIEKEWKKQFPEAVVKLMHEAVEATLSDASTSYIQIFLALLDKNTQIDRSHINTFEILVELERLVTNQSRLLLLKALDFPITLFGRGADELNWPRLLKKKKPEVEALGPISYTEALEVMRESKVVLNSCPAIKKGGHERIFSALYAGALVITDENVFMQDQFREGIPFYTYLEASRVNNLVREALQNEGERCMMVRKAQAVVEKNHTWDRRAETIIRFILPECQRIKENKAPSRSSTAGS